MNDQNEPKPFRRGERIHHYSEGSGTVYQDQTEFFTVVYIEFDSRKGIAQSVNPRDIRRAA